MPGFISTLDVPFISEWSVCSAAAERLQLLPPVYLLLRRTEHPKATRERMASFNLLLDFRRVNTAPAVWTFLKRQSLVCFAVCHSVNALGASTPIWNTETVKSNSIHRWIMSVQKLKLQIHTITRWKCPVLLWGQAKFIHIYTLQTFITGMDVMATGP